MIIATTTTKSEGKEETKTKEKKRMTRIPKSFQQLIIYSHSCLITNPLLCLQLDPLHPSSQGSQRPGQTET